MVCLINKYNHLIANQLADVAKMAAFEVKDTLGCDFLILRGRKMSVS